MPLEKSSSKGAFVRNLKTEIHAGKPRSQALAIAYDVKRRNRADGGELSDTEPDTSDRGLFDPRSVKESIQRATAGNPQKVFGAVTQYPGHVVEGLATLPKRAIEGAAEYNETGNTDAILGPTLETARTMIGGAGAVPMRGGMTLGSGMLRSRYDKALAEGKITPAEHQGFVEALGANTEASLADKFSGQQRHIADIIKESGLPKDQVHKWLVDEAKAGRVTIHPTTSVDLPKESMDAGIRLPGFSEPFITAYFKPKAKRAKGGPVNKALNIAYADRRQARADGGGVFEGPIVSDVPGRTDKHEMDVAAGSYVIPSETVSHLGENNTIAGMKHLKQVGPHGIRKMAMAAKGAHEIARKHRLKRAVGGSTSEDDTGHPVPVITAGGEHVLSPDEVRIIGGGDVTLGHRLLDNWVLSQRKNHVKTLSALDPPAKD